ncbi:MAG: DUF2200 domain-containing protein, partial [Thioalkalivibrio sp.]|nr:DUF2200 domain-containing protein [Thioalkalivibrio sp.]
RLKPDDGNPGAYGVAPEHSRRHDRRTSPRRPAAGGRAESETRTETVAHRQALADLLGLLVHQRSAGQAEYPISRGWLMAKHRIYTTSFASVYPHYVTKAEKKGRSRAEVDEIIRWLTGYGQDELDAQLEKRTDFETFFAEAPQMNPLRASIKGVICGVRVEDIEEPTMREIRYLDKLVDELAKGKAMEKILRKP